MKKLFKLFTVSLCAVMVVGTLSACRAGANDPGRAARNILTAVSNQNFSRMAALVGLEGPEREGLISEFENRVPSRGDRDEWEAHRERLRALNSIRFVDVSGPTVGAVDQSTHRTLIFSFMQRDTRGSLNRVERTVTLNFIRGESGRWYSERANIETIQNAVN